MKEGFLLIVSGPSGSGKGTVCKELMENNDNIIFSVSATTRLPREGEVDGVNYFFVTEDEFNSMVGNDEFLEHANVHTNMYGTPKKFVLDQIQKGNIVLLEIDVQGALQVMNSFENTVSVFLLPPSLEVLESRLRNRATESEDKLKVRLSNAKNEINLVDKYDYYVVNDILEDAVLSISEIINSENLKVSRNKNIKENYER